MVARRLQKDLPAATRAAQHEQHGNADRNSSRPISMEILFLFRPAPRGSLFRVCSLLNYFFAERRRQFSANPSSTRFAKWLVRSLVSAPGNASFSFGESFRDFFQRVGKSSDIARVRSHQRRMDGCKFQFLDRRNSFEWTRKSTVAN